MTDTDLDPASPTPEDRHSDDALLRMVKRHKKEGDTHLAEWRQEAEECYAFVAGDQWKPEDKAKLEEMLRVPVVFNRIGPMVEAVAGSEVSNRQRVQYIPRTPGDTGVNDVLTGAADYFRDQCDAEDEESDMFLDTAICGVGVTETHLDYIENPEGMIPVERRDPLSMRWDPSSKKRNLTDKKWCQREEWLDEDEVKDRWPDKAEDVCGTADGWANESTSPHDSTLSWMYKKDNSGYDAQTGKRRVLHEQWYELETYYLIADFAIDPMTQQMVYGRNTVEMEREQYETLAERLKKLGIPLQSVKKQRKRWYQVFVCGDTVLEFSPVPGNECAFKFATAKRDRNSNTWYGIVRAMIDPQRWANKFFSQFLHIINTNAKGGMVVEKGAVDNLPKFKSDWAKSDGVTVVEDGAISRKKLMPKPPPLVPPQMAQLLEFSISSLRDVTGINLEMLGLADRDQPGVLEAHRKQAALTVLAGLFDSLRRYRKEQGRLYAKLIAEYMSDGRLVRIVGGDGTEKYVPLVKDPAALEFDVIVDETPNTPNQKLATFGILMQMLPALEKMGVPFTADLLQYTPLPAAMVERWGRSIEEQKQQPKPPPPQAVSAMANMKRADAALMNAQTGAQKVAVDAQAKQQQSAQDAYLAPFEMQNKAAEIDLDRQELMLRRWEAVAEILKAQAASRTAAIQGLNIGNPMH